MAEDSPPNAHEDLEQQAFALFGSGVVMIEFGGLWMPSWPRRGSRVCTPALMNLEENSTNSAKKKKTRDQCEHEVAYIYAHTKFSCAD